MSKLKVALITVLVVLAAIVVGVVVSVFFLANFLGGKSAEESSQVLASSLPLASSYWTGANAGSTPLLVQSQAVLQNSTPPQSVSEIAVSSLPAPPAQENLPTPAGFLQAPTVAVNGSSVSVTFKTAASATVNCILATGGQEISVGTFYDYFSRGGEFATAVEKRANFKAGPEGVTEVFELPDATKSYWLYINTVDNQTDKWEQTVTAVQIFSP